MLLLEHENPNLEQVTENKTSIFHPKIPNSEQHNKEGLFLEIRNMCKPFNIP